MYRFLPVARSIAVKCPGDISKRRSLSKLHLSLPSPFRCSKHGSISSKLHGQSDTSTIGNPGQVSVPGITSYTSVIDTSRIFLLTDYGDHYTVPRFSFNQTGDQSVFFSKFDQIDIKSFITFRVASTGVLGETKNDIVLLYPNGGEALLAGTDYEIQFKTYGNVSNVNIHYALGSELNDDQWQEIATNVATNSDSLSSYPWTPSIIADSVRIRIQEVNSKLNDVSGWYFTITGGQFFRNSSPINLFSNPSHGLE